MHPSLAIPLRPFDIDFGLFYYSFVLLSFLVLPCIVLSEAEHCCTSSNFICLFHRNERVFCDQDGIRSDTNILQVTMPLTYAYIFDNSITIYDNKRVKMEKERINYSRLFSTSALSSPDSMLANYKGRSVRYRSTARSNTRTDRK